MKVPKYIMEAICQQYGFEKLVNAHLKNSKTHQDAYDAAVDDIKQYFPEIKMYSSYESFKSVKHRPITKRYRASIDVPQDVIDAISTKEGYFDLFNSFYMVNKNSTWAFKRMMEYIHIYAPGWWLYSTARSLIKNRARYIRKQ